MEPDDQTIKSDVGPYSESYGGCRRKVIMSNVVTLSEQLFPTCNTCCFYGALVSTICITYMYYEAKEENEEFDGNDQLKGIFLPCAQENCKSRLQVIVSLTRQLNWLGNGANLVAFQSSHCEY